MTSTTKSNFRAIFRNLSVCSNATFLGCMHLCTAYNILVNVTYNTSFDYILLFVIEHRNGDDISANEFENTTAYRADS